jgi:amino acid adenylation domain-containing protein
VKGGNPTARLPVTASATQQVLSLPVHPALSHEDLSTVAREVVALCKREVQALIQPGFIEHLYEHQIQEVSIMHNKGGEIANESRVLSISSVQEAARQEQGTNQFSPSNWEQQLATWNATEQEYPIDACVPHLVSIQAATTPDAAAIHQDDHILTYRELNQRANQLAHYLQTLGVGPNTLVALCVERSMDMVVGLLGILKAGGAYVPLDPAYPPERLAFMLEDSAAPVLVTRQHVAHQLPIQGLGLVCLDVDSPVLTAQSASDPTSKVTADDLAYVIYTSGSTGRPKGVQITHKSLLNLVFWHQRAFGVTSSDKATQLTSTAFDATGWELWPYLTCGASVYLLNEEQRVDPLLCRDFLLEQQITITFLTTALAESVMVLEWPSQTVLRFLLTGADTLHHYPSPRLPFALINNYGPTEATVVTTSRRITPMTHAERPPSIGRPIDNIQIYILDEHLRQVPIGTAGELYIGGVGLAKGYLNRPELNAEKFIPHPWSDKPGERLYRSGDLARFLPDGHVDFLGRLDHQIKIRGYRIEPDEITSVLNGHPAVQASLVLAREDTPGDKRLVAYIVLNQGMSACTDALQEWLAERLPDYMIPVVFVHLDSLPVTANGKVDRAALPAPDASNTLQREDMIATPRTQVEERLAAIVTSLLGLEQIGIDDNIFFFGGNSLMGTQIIVQVADTFGVELTLRTLFDGPTIRQLAEEVERLVIARLESMSDEEVLQLLNERHAE